jgi:hypothetical protein
MAAKPWRFSAKRGPLHTSLLPPSSSLDLHLRKIDGDQVLPELRRLPAFQILPIVVLSAAAAGQERVGEVVTGQILGDPARYLIDLYEEISYAPSAAALHRRQHRRRPSPQEVFLVCNPDRAGQYGRPLQHAEREAQRIRAHYPDTQGQNRRRVLLVPHGCSSVPVISPSERLGSPRSLV